jgi:glutamyl-tRNA synthetase
MHIYKKYVNMLLNKNLAYEHNGAIKFRMTKEPITIHDIIVGNVVRELTDREQLDPDFVIVRADGQPVFHLTNVVDDLEMAITHVIRGEDHLSNTSKHIALFNAFGAEPPKYAHIPLILNPDGSKMSKRDQGASILYYQEGGFLPEAVVNYLLLLGWSPKDDRQILPIQEVIQIFDLPQILRHNARFDHKKLLWMNYEYIRKLPLERFVEFAVPAFQKIGLDLNKFDKNYVLSALETCKEKIKTFNELPSFADFYFLDQLQFPDDAVKKEFTNENLLRLKTLADALALLADFTPDKIEMTLKTTAEKLAVKPAALVHPLRLACTGRSFGPSLYHLMSVLGKEKVLSRVNHVIEKFYQTK